MTKLEFDIVDCLVEREERFLLVQEGRPGREGKWNIPGGHVQGNETLVEAAMREVEEESGWIVRVTGFLGNYQSVFGGKLNVGGPVFLGRVIRGEAKTSEEHPAQRWVTADELFAMAKAGELWTKYPPRLIEDYQRRGSYPLDAISCVRY